MDTPPLTTTPKVVDYVNTHLVDYVNVTPSHLVDSVNADTGSSCRRLTINDDAGIRLLFALIS